MTLEDLTRKDTGLFKDFLRPGQTMHHYIENTQWANCDAIEGGREALDWWYGCMDRLMRTVAAFQPGSE